MGGFSNLGCQLRRNKSSTWKVIKMDNFLIQTFSIKNHPICKLKEKFRVQYVMGLGEFMCYISKKDNRASLVFKVWARSIVENVPASYWQCSERFVLIKNALSIKRDGLRLFTMRRSFFFDCLYLASKMDSKNKPIVFNFLKEHVRGIFARKVLMDIYNNWGYPSLQKIPYQLMAHWRTVNDFQNKPMKRILVVATVSAGKSTLINALAGFRINEVKTTVCTNSISYLYNKPVSDGIVTKGIDNRYRFRYDVEAMDRGKFTEAALHFNSTLSDCRICLIDTPGANYSADTTHGEMTRKAIASNNYDAVIFVVNSTQFNTVDEANLRDFVLKHTKKPIVFAINKLDCYNPEDDSIQETINKLSNLIGQRKKQCSIVPISAYYALLLKIPQNKMNKQEQIQLNRLSQLFQYDYYDMTNYFQAKGKQTRTKKEIDKTGITMLEEVIMKI